MDFLDVRHYKGRRSSALSTGRLYPRRNPWYSFSEAESNPGHMVPSVEIRHVAYRIIKKNLFLVIIQRGEFPMDCVMPRLYWVGERPKCEKKSYNWKWPLSCTVRFMFLRKPLNLLVYKRWGWWSLPSGDISHRLNDNICNTFKPPKHDHLVSVYSTWPHYAGTEIHRRCKYGSKMWNSLVTNAHIFYCLYIQHSWGPGVA